MKTIKFDMLLNRRIPLFIASFIVTNIVNINLLYADNNRWGYTLGLGGTGIIKQEDVNGAKQTVQRSESPGVFSFFYENQISDTQLLGIEHSRGFRFGPFSSGVSFTGFTSRWYFNGPILSFPENSQSDSHIFIKQYNFFIGWSIGIANGSITRDNDMVPLVAASGVYTGFKIGSDCPLKPGSGIRYELVYDTTFYSQESNAGSLSQFALQAGYYFVF